MLPLWNVNKMLQMCGFYISSAYDWNGISWNAKQVPPPLQLTAAPVIAVTHGTYTTRSFDIEEQSSTQHDSGTVYFYGDANRRITGRTAVQR